DTEVIAQLIAHHLRDGDGPPPDSEWADLPYADFLDAVSRALAHLKGTYGLVVLSPLYPDVLIGARLGSPLVLGLGKGENFLASDPNALLGQADKVVYLRDHQLCALTPEEWHILDHERSRVEADVHDIEWDAADADKGLFEHHMLKEIYE